MRRARARTRRWCRARRVRSPSGRRGPPPAGVRGRAPGAGPGRRRGRRPARWPPWSRTETVRAVSRVTRSSERPPAWTIALVTSSERHSSAVSETSLGDARPARGTRGGSVGRSPAARGSSSSTIRAVRCPSSVGVGVVLVQVVAADPDPAYGVRGSARRRLEQPALRVVEGPVLLEEDDEATDRRADAGQRDRGQGLDLGRLARDELVEPRVERAAVAQHRFAGAHDGGERHVVVGVDVAPVDAVVVGPVTRGEPQPPAAALGQREPDPAHAGQRDQVREQASGDVVDR